MLIDVDGRVRVRTRKGGRIFRADQWHDQPFHVRLDTENATCIVLEPPAEIMLELETVKDRVFLRAVIRGNHFVIAECDPNSDQALPFSILSVGGFEVNGRVTVRSS